MCESKFSYIQELLMERGCWKKAISYSIQVKHWLKYSQHSRSITSRLFRFAHDLHKKVDEELIE